MTTTITKGQELHLPALHGPSTYSSTASASDLTREEARAVLRVARFIVQASRFADLTYYVPRCIPCHRGYDAKQRGDLVVENR